MRNLTLFIPGLFGPHANYADEFMPVLPTLEWLLCHATHTRTTESSIHRVIAGLLGLDLDDNRDVPVAAITRLVDDSGPVRGCWMRADPVHLSPDRDGLVLMDSFILGLSQHDALALAAEVNRILADYGWMVEVPGPDRWYIRLDETPDITTTDLPAVVGRDINRYLPDGADAAKLHRILNEVQMQLHDCEVNQYREGKGELPVNSIWFWGVGEMPPDFHAADVSVYGEDSFLKGLSLKAGRQCLAPPAGLEELLGGGDDIDDALLLLQHCQAPAQYQNLQLWHEALLVLEQHWFEPALRELNRGGIRSLRIMSGDQIFHTGLFSRLKFWRKSRLIGDYR